MRVHEKLLTINCASLNKTAQMVVFLHIFSAHLTREKDPFLFLIL